MIQVLGDQSKGRKYDPSLASRLNAETPHITSEKSESKNHSNELVSSVSSDAFSLDYLRSPNEENRGNFIILPGRQYGSYSYPDLLIGKSTRVGVAENDWKEAQRNLANRGSFMLNLRQFIDFLNLLHEAEKIYDGNGKIIPEQEIRGEFAILYQTLRTNLNGAGERIDAIITNRNGRVMFESNTRVIGGHLSSTLILPLDQCLMHNNAVFNIDYNDWRHTSTPQGFPIAETKSKSLDRIMHYENIAPNLEDAELTTVIFKQATTKYGPVKLVCTSPSYKYRGLSFRSAYVREAPVK